MQVHFHALLVRLYVMHQMNRSAMDTLGAVIGAHLEQCSMCRDELERMRVRAVYDPDQTLLTDVFDAQLPLWEPSSFDGRTPRFPIVS